MTVTTSKPRIHLRMEGQPQASAEAAALLLHLVLKFCAQPETFPVFMASATAKSADAPWVLYAAQRMTPELIESVRIQIAAGVVADLEDES